MTDNNRCYLCGQKLRKGVCTCCGLDNARMTRRDYRLNETTPYHVKRQQVAERKAESMEYAKAYKEKQQKLEHLGKPVKTSASQRRTYTQKNHTGNKKEQKGSKRGVLKILGIFYALVAFSPAIGSCIDDISDDFTTSVPEYEAEAYNIEDEYLYVERELSETGDDYEAELGPGYYYVGVHIPEGNYTVSFSQGSYGNLYISDEANRIYMTPSFAADEEDSYYNTELTDVRLYEGAYFEISGDVHLYFVSENAQTNMLGGMENPIDATAAVVLEASEKEYVVGKDIPIGVYDIQVEEEYASVQVMYINEVNSTYHYYWLNADSSEMSYKNVLLTDGMTVLVEYRDVLFTPSEWIITDDYDTYIKEYFF